ncbi:MAG: alpha/beta fold hydrolase [Armatimonadetes bacterium]|nr:alpha/beta fold hydrolase [Armatimonadota bacterium]
MSNRWIRLASAIGAVLVGGVLLAAWLTADGVVRPRRLPVRKTPGDLGLPYEDVSFKAQDGMPLKGWWLVNAPENRTIILCHGISANREQALPLSALFFRRGYNVFAFDFRAHGESAGVYCTVGVREQEDLLAAVRAVRERGSGPIGVLGMSMGGATALLAAARSLDIEAVAADSAFFSMSKLIEDTFTIRYRLPYWPVGPLSFVIGYWRTAEDLRNISPARTIARISPRPVLLLHGSADTVIPAEHSRALYRQTKEPKELVEIPGAGHIGSYGEATALYERKILAYFNKWLARKEEANRRNARWRVAR